MLRWHFQAAAFVRLFSILSITLPLPSKYIRPAIQCLLFILGSFASTLPPVSSSQPSSRPSPRSFGELSDSDETSNALANASWELILDLLSGSYSITVGHEIQQNLLSAEYSRNVDEPHDSEARKACGAARALRSALRQGSQHRLALSRNEDLEDSPAVYSLVISSEMGWLRHYGEVGSSLDADQTHSLFGRAIRRWLASAMSNKEAEAVVIECIGVASDVIDECNASDRLVTDDEAHLVGDILREAVECFRGRYAFVTTGFPSQN